MFKSNKKVSARLLRMLQVFQQKISHLLPCHLSRLLEADIKSKIDNS